MNILSFHVADGTPEGLVVQINPGDRAKLTSLSAGGDVRVPVIEHAADEDEVVYYPIGRVISIEVESRAQRKLRLELVGKGK